MQRFPATEMLSPQAQVPASVISWNCLADCYSHASSAEAARQEILAWPFRFELIKRVLTRHNADIVCLQEVDHFLTHFEPFFLSAGYNFKYAERPGREDGLVIAFKRHKFALLQSHIVHHDDLAQFDATVLQPLRKPLLRRKNVALMLLLKALSTNATDEIGEGTARTARCDMHLWNGRNVRPIAVCTAHLFWNPLYPDVKLAQSLHLLERLVNVRVPPFEMTPIATIVAGDFNSEPGTAPLIALHTGAALSPTPRLDSRMAARIAIARTTRRKGRPSTTTMTKGTDLAAGHVRFLCDATLTKLVRWLRLVGVDCALEDSASQESRAQCNDYSPLFDRALREGRILVTTSPAMRKRNTCPESFLIRISDSDEKLMQCLADLLNHYNVRLKPSNFFLLCSKCGGNVVKTFAEDERIKCRFAPTDRQIYICDCCHKVYWWSASPKGTSKAAIQRAETIYAFVEKSRRKHATRLREIESVEAFEEAINHDPLSSIPPCRQEWLRLRSAYHSVHGKEPQFTNLNGTYRGTLDYIFIGGALTAINAGTDQHVLGSVSHDGDSLYPNSMWPSDHLLIRADLMIHTERPARLWFPRTLSDMHALPSACRTHPIFKGE